MHRNKLLSLLHSYKPTLEEQVAKERIVAFIKKYPNCFERTLTIGHITASAWLLNHDMSKALIMHHTKLDMWMQLGGHCDGNSDVLEVALKEAQEESGIENIIPVSAHIFDVDVHLVPANKKEAAHYHYDIRFLLKTAHEQDFVQNSESKELRWISKNRAELPTQERSVIRMFEKWLKI